MLFSKILSGFRSVRITGLLPRSVRSATITQGSKVPVSPKAAAPSPAVGSGGASPVKKRTAFAVLSDLFDLLGQVSDVNAAFGGQKNG